MSNMIPQESLSEVVSHKQQNDDRRSPAGSADDLRRRLLRPTRLWRGLTRLGRVNDVALAARRDACPRSRWHVHFSADAASAPGNWPLCLAPARQSLSRTGNRDRVSGPASPPAGGCRDTPQRRLVLSRHDARSWRSLSAVFIPLRYASIHSTLRAAASRGTSHRPLCPGDGGLRRVAYEHPSVCIRLHRSSRSLTNRYRIAGCGSALGPSETSGCSVLQFRAVELAVRT